MLEPRRTLERVGLATLGGDRDALMAMGVAAVRGHAEALPLLRLHLAATKSDFEAATRYVLGVVNRLANKERWHIRTYQLDEIAATALAHHVCPVCRHCHGRKLVLSPGSDTLSPKACTHCRGEGRRPVQALFRNYIERTLVELEMLDNKTEASVRKILS